MMFYVFDVFTGLSAFHAIGSDEAHAQTPLQAAEDLFDASDTIHAPVVVFPLQQTGQECKTCNKVVQDIEQHQKNDHPMDENVQFKPRSPVKCLACLKVKRGCAPFSA